MDSAEDWRRCGTCGIDLSALYVCPEAPIAPCGCPEYDVVNDEHPTGQRYTVAGAARAYETDAAGVFEMVAAGELIAVRPDPFGPWVIWSHA